MTAGTPPWESATYERGDGGFGVVLRLTGSFPTVEAAQEAARYLCAVADVRLGEGVGRRLLEAAQDERPCAAEAPPFRAPV